MKSPVLTSVDQLWVGWREDIPETKRTLHLMHSEGRGWGTPCGLWWDPQEVKVGGARLAERWPRVPVCRRCALKHGPWLQARLRGTLEMLGAFAAAYEKNPIRWYPPGGRHLQRRGGQAKENTGGRQRGGR